MISGKDVYGIFLSSLLAVGGLGCAELPLQRPAESGHQPQPPLTPTNSQPAADLRIPAPPINKPVSAAGDPREILPVGASSASDPVAKLHALYRDAAARYASIDSYIVRL